MKLSVTSIKPIGYKWFEVVPDNVFDAMEFFQQTYFNPNFIVHGNTIYTNSLDHVSLK